MFCFYGIFPRFLRHRIGVLNHIFGDRCGDDKKAAGKVLRLSMIQKSGLDRCLNWFILRWELDRRGLMQNTTIEWTDRTWNPTKGCSKVSDGCKNCYAMQMAARLEAMGQCYLSVSPCGCFLPCRAWRSNRAFLQCRTNPLRISGQHCHACPW